MSHHCPNRLAACTFWILSPEAKNIKTVYYFASHRLDVYLELFAQIPTCDVQLLRERREWVCHGVQLPMLWFLHCYRCPLFWRCDRGPSLRWGRSLWCSWHSSPLPWGRRWCTETELWLALGLVTSYQELVQLHVVDLPGLHQQPVQPPVDLK